MGKRPGSRAGAQPGSDSALAMCRPQYSREHAAAGICPRTRGVVNVRSTECPLPALKPPARARPEATCRAGYAPSTSLVPAGAPEPYGRPVCHAGRRMDEREANVRLAGSTPWSTHRWPSAAARPPSTCWRSARPIRRHSISYGRGRSARCWVRLWSSPRSSATGTGSGMPVASGVSGSAWAPWRCWGSGQRPAVRPLRLR